MSPRLAFALEAAFRAGRLTLAHFQVQTPVDSKADLSPVTHADREAERLIRRMIEDHYPGEAILGEEEGGSDGTERWVIDPIDGTKSFISGVPLYGTLLSYEQDGRPILGVAHFPALNEMVYAEAGGGAFFNGRACRVSDKAKIAGGVVCAGSHKSMRLHNRSLAFDSIADKALATRTWGDAYGHCLVATGRVEAMIDPVVNYWDVSAVSLIVREAGGRFTDFDGGNVLAREAISSNGLVHEELLEAFRR